MANTSISNLTAGAAVSATDVVPNVQTEGVGPVKTTAAELKTFMSASPTLVTPNIGVATATSVNKVTLTAPATSATLTIADGKTLTASNSLTFTGTDSSSIAFGTGGTVAYTANNLSVFAATTSAQLAGVISDETGSGSLVFATSPSLTTPNIGAATGTSLVTTSTVAMGSSFLRNKLINGGMRIDQRNNGASQTITAAAALAYTVDRWYAYCTGANVTGQRVANTGTTVSPSQNAYQFTGAASVTEIGFAQRIEAANCFDLANTTATLSVNLANSLLTTVTWTAYYANTADTFGTLASPTRTLIATGTFTVSSTLTNYSANISIPAAATTGIEIVFTVGAQTSGTWTIGNVQLEAGTIVTPFERRQITTEVALCQRYYQKYDGNNNSNSGVYGQAYSTSACRIDALLPTPMRVNPTTLAVSNLTVDAIGIGNKTFTASGTVFATTGVLNTVVNFDLTGSSGLTAQQKTVFLGTLTVSAEL